MSAPETGMNRWTDHQIPEIEELIHLLNLQYLHIISPTRSSNSQLVLTPLPAFLLSEMFETLPQLG